MRELELPGGTAFLLDYPGESEFDALVTETPWRQRKMYFGGREVLQPRLTAWYGDPSASYRYSGVLNDPLPWTPTIQRVRDHVETLLETTFNGVLLNYYRDGKDSVSFHADDEKRLGLEPIIASVSFGATRTMRFRHRHKLHSDVEVDLTDGSLLVMMGQTQQNWLHAIEKVPCWDGRVNLTFRQILPPS